MSLPSSKAHVDIRRIQRLLNQILKHSFPHIKDFVKCATLKETFKLIYKLLRMVKKGLRYWENNLMMFVEECLPLSNNLILIVVHGP